MMHKQFPGSLVMVLLFVAACAPAPGQPVFSQAAIPSATAIPMQPDVRVVATLAQRITAFDVSPDGKVLALASSGDLRLYDLGTYRLLRRLQAGELIGSVAWSLDGTKLAVGSTKDYGTPFFVGGDASNSWKARLVVYDTATWKTIFEPAFGIEMVNQQFIDMAWSPDGRSLAFSMDLGGVRVLDTQTGTLISRQDGFAAGVTDISWSPDGSRLLANNDMAYGIRRWRVSDGQSVRLFDQRLGSARALAWSPDGKRIASGHTDGGLCFWTAATNRCDGYVHAHQSVTFSLAWSPDGNELATGGGVLRIWDTHTGQLIRAFGEQSGYLYDLIEWPAQGGPLISLATSLETPGNTQLTIWDVHSAAILAQWSGQQRLQ